MDDLSPFTWMTTVSTALAAMDWWVAGGGDRTPLVTLGYPLAFLDRCDCGRDTEGQLTVQAGPVFFAGDRFPDQATQPVKTRDGEDRWGVNLTVEYARCRPVMDGQGSLPTPEALTNFSRGLYADAMAIWHHLHCQANAWSQTPGLGSIVARGFAPITRDIGHCAGFSFDLTGRVADCQPCGGGG